MSSQATVRQPLLALVNQLQVKLASRAFFETIGLLPKQVDGNLVSELGDGEWNALKLHGLPKLVLAEDAGFENFELDHEFPRV